MHPREKNFETTAVKEKCTSYMKKKMFPFLILQEKKRKIKIYYEWVEFPSLCKGKKNKISRMSIWHILKKWLARLKLIQLSPGA